MPTLIRWLGAGFASSPSADPGMTSGAAHAAPVAAAVLRKWRRVTMRGFMARRFSKRVNVARYSRIRRMFSGGVSSGMAPVPITQLVRGADDLQHVVDRPIDPLRDRGRRPRRGRD